MYCWIKENIKAALNQIILQSNKIIVIFQLLKNQLLNQNKNLNWSDYQNYSNLKREFPWNIKMQKLVLISLLFLLIPAPVFSEGITKEQGNAILEELRAIKKELREIKKKGLAAAPQKNAGPQ